MNTKAYIDEIQPTMKMTVAWLRGLGFITIDSGDGVLNVEAGMEGAMDFPHVFMRVDPSKMVEQAKTLLEACQNLKIEEAQIEVSYSPSDGLAVLSLIGVTDEAFATCGFVSEKHRFEFHKQNVLEVTGKGV